jgi:hypothetical protein
VQDGYALHNAVVRTVASSAGTISGLVTVSAAMSIYVSKVGSLSRGFASYREPRLEAALKLLLMELRRTTKLSRSLGSFKPSWRNRASFHRSSAQPGPCSGRLATPLRGSPVRRHGEEEVTK